MRFKAKIKKHSEGWEMKVIDLHEEGEIYAYSVEEEWGKAIDLAIFSLSALASQREEGSGAGATNESPNT